MLNLYFKKSKQNDIILLADLIITKKRFLGQYSNEGFGRIKWIECTVENYKRKSIQKYKKFTFRKGLGCKYPKELQRLLRAIMLHDFVPTELHPSKIYHKIDIKDDEIREACENHHNKNFQENKYLHALRKLDSLASYITRKKPLKSISRYDYENGTIDFEQLKKEIEARQDSAYKLYSFIYHSEDLKRVVEALDYQKSSLRTHLLLMVNLAINKYYMDILIIENEKIIIRKRQNSTSVKKKRKNLVSTSDAEIASKKSLS